MVKEKWQLNNVLNVKKQKRLIVLALTKECQAVASLGANFAWLKTKDSNMQLTLNTLGV
jgi:hypothetical protein